MIRKGSYWLLVMIHLPIKMIKNAATGNLTPAYEDDQKTQLLLMLLLPMKMKLINWTLNKNKADYFDEQLQGLILGWAVTELG